MRNIILIIVFFALNGIEIISQTGWVQVPVKFDTTQSLNSVHFINNLTGYTAGSDGLVFKSIDGGNFWTPQQTNEQNVLMTVRFVNTFTGFVTTINGGVTKTTNGGNSWLGQQLIQSLTNSIHFINENTGWIGSQSDRIFKTTNSGGNWTPIITGASLNTYVHFFNESTGWSAGLGIIKTTNGGANWAILPVYADTIVHTVFFINELTGWVNTLHNISKTTNGGANWTRLNTPINNRSIYSMHFVNQNIGWVVGTSGLILSTVDGGATWTTQSSGTSRPLHSIFFINSATGWAVGPGTILKTTNGGITGVISESEEIPERYWLSQNYPNPFNPNTKLRFAIPKFGFVGLKIYDALGKEITTLVYEQLNAGTYEVDWDASNYPNGVYFYWIKAEGFVETRKMVLVK